MPLTISVDKADSGSPEFLKVIQKTMASDESYSVIEAGAPDAMLAVFGVNTKSVK